MNEGTIEAGFYNNRSWMDRTGLWDRKSGQAAPKEDLETPVMPP